MANIQSAKKRIRSSARQETRNRMRKSKVRTAVRNAGEALDNNDLSAARTAVIQAVSQLDKAAQNGVIHRNQAARHKSKLMSRLFIIETET